MPAAVSSAPNPHHHHHGPTKEHHSHSQHDVRPHDSHGPPSPDTTTSSTSSRHTYTHLTYSRHHLIDIAMETIKIAENGEYTNSKGKLIHLKHDLDYSVENCVHYEHEFDFHKALKDYDAEEANGGMLRSLAESDTSTTSSDFGSLHSSGTLKLSFKSGIGGTSQRFSRTSFLVVSASWLESASELLGASSDSNIRRVGVLNSASGTTPGGRFLKGTVSQEDCLCRASLLYSCISQPKFQSEGRFYGKNRSLRYGTSNCVIFSPGEQCLLL